MLHPVVCLIGREGNGDRGRAVDSSMRDGHGERQVREPPEVVADMSELCT